MVADNFLVTASDGASLKIAINITIKLSTAKAQITIPNILIIYYVLFVLTIAAQTLGHKESAAPTIFPIRLCTASTSYGEDCAVRAQLLGCSFARLSISEVQIQSGIEHLKFVSLTKHAAKLHKILLIKPSQMLKSHKM